MASLTGKKPKNTYKDLLQVSNSNAGIDGTLRFVSDGEGTDSTLKLSTASISTTSKIVVGGDTAASDAAAIGYTSAEGLIITGQGSTSDITVKNDADAAVLTIATGTTNVDIVGDVTASTVNADGDTSASDNAAMGYTSAEGLILTGQVSTNDITIKNDADADVITVATGGTNVDIVGDVTAATVNADGDTSAGDDAAMGYTSAEGLILTGQGSTNDITIKNDADSAVLSVPTGTTNVTIAGDLTISGDDLTMGTNTSGAALIADGTNFNPVVISGDVSIGTDGAATIANNAVSLAKMAGLARGKLIYGDSSGDPAALAVGSANNVLKSDGTDASWGTVATAGIADDSITSAKIADDAVVTAAIADDAITSALIADDAVVSAAIADDAITAALIADDAVGSAAIADDAITSALIADDAVVTAAIADDAITSALIADDAVVSAAIADSAVVTAAINDDAVTLAKMAGLARGKIIYGDSSGNPAALAIGSNNYVLTSDGTDAAWAAAGTGAVTSYTNSTNNRVITSVDSTTINGEANLTFDGSALNVVGTVTVGVDDTGHDVKFFGATAGSYMLWDQDEDDLILGGAARMGIGTTDLQLFNSVGGTTALAVVGDSSSTAILGNTGASIAIVNTDTTSENTAGLHFARADTDNTPNYAGASIVAQFGETQATGQYPSATLNFLTSSTQNAAPSLKMTIAANGNTTINGTLTTAAGGIATASLADDAVTLAKMASGTDGNLITYDASGNPAHVATGSSTQVLTSNGAGAAPTFQAASSGAVKQVVYQQKSALATGSTVMVLDDTIPQNTEGDEYFSLAITPTSATNLLIIECGMSYSSSTPSITTQIAALFQDSTAGALATVHNENAIANTGVGHQMHLMHHMTSGTTSSTTFKIRAGTISGTFALNGISGARKWGGSAASFLRITEVDP